VIDFYVVSAIFVALICGAVIGWLIQSRISAAGAETALQLRQMLDAVVFERDTAKDSLARLEASLNERERGFNEQIKLLSDSKEILASQFGEIGQKILGEAQAKFLQRADERFQQAGETSEAKLKLLLSPMDEALKSYATQVERVEKERNEAYGDLKGLIGEMKQGQERVQSEASRIVSSLRTAPKTGGRWGEQQFENLLELAGLKRGLDYRREVSAATDDGILRPDFVIMLPGDQQLIVDIKCPLDAYMAGIEGENLDDRRDNMAKHAAAVRGHANALGKKAYWAQFEKAPDYVVLYVPGDNFLSAALESDLSLWEEAARNRVIISGPATFFPLAKTIASMWRQKKLSDDAREIGALGKEMHERIAVAAEHLKKMGVSLNRSVNQYNDFVGSFERNVMSTGRKFAELNIETGKRELEDVPMVEALPRYANEMERSLIQDTREQNDNNDAEDAAPGLLSS
jgi:DNA recombination protein RmuC